jgi:hypothetical protein
MTMLQLDAALVIIPQPDSLGRVLVFIDDELAYSMRKNWGHIKEQEQA